MQLAAETIVTCQSDEPTGTPVVRQIGNRGRKGGVAPVLLDP